MKAGITFCSTVVLVLLTFCESILAVAPLDPPQWTQPAPVSEINTDYHDKSPFLSFDGLTLYFARQDGPGWHYTRIYQARRQQPTGPFASVEEISALNYGGGHVDYPHVSSDNLRMYYYRTEGSSNCRLKFTSKRTLGESWLPGNDITELNVLGPVACPSLTEDELTIVFSLISIWGDENSYDIWIATRPSRSTKFSNLINLKEINSPVLDAHPRISPDGLTLFFASDRNGTRQLFRATRESLEAPFGNLEQLSFFDSPNAIVCYPFLSPDDTTFYFVKWPNGGFTDIYVSYLTGPQQGRTYYVDTANGSDTNSGLTTKTAFATIQKAIDIVRSGDTVIVYRGTYHENINFKGKNITLRSMDPNSPDLVAATVIDGRQKGSVVTFNAGEQPTCILNGFTITNGYASEGGGIYCSKSSPAVINCILSRNSASVEGGAIFICDNSRPTLTDCHITDNSAINGGGIRSMFSNPVLSNCAFSDNSAEWGGAIFNNDGSPQLNNCTFARNSAEGPGGGMFNSSANPMLTDCTFNKNSATWGGAIYCEPGLGPTLVRCTITQNSAQFAGGMYLILSNSTVTNSFISANSATSGGAILCELASLMITNTLFSENTASDGGVILTHSDANVVMANCTFVRNNAVHGKTVACTSIARATTVAVLNSILWNGGDEIWNNEGAAITVSYSDMQTLWPGQGNISADPQFAPDGYHLQPTSPCINTGDPAGNYTQQTDIDGEPRVFNGRADIGADESFYVPKAIYYHVDALNGSDLNSGLTPQTAFATIQKAIDTAQDHDKVLVYPGTYAEAISFKGKAITLQSAADAAILESPDDFAVSFYHGEGPDSVLKNFIIKDSMTAVFMVRSSPTIANLTVVNNEYGIEAYAGSNPDISNCVFWNNAAGDLFGCKASYSWVQDNIESEPPAGLIAHWAFDEAIGTTAHDSISGIDGTIYGATWTAGWIGGALNFDGDDDGVYLEPSAGTNSPLNIYNSDMTVSAWVKIRTGGSIIARAKPYHIAYSLGVAAKEAFIATWTPQPGYWVLTTSPDLAQEIWYHIVGVFDRTHDKGCIYVDGVHRAGAEMKTDPQSSEVVTKIGCGNDLHYQPFDGLVDDVMFFNKALSAEEVKQLYQQSVTKHGYRSDPLFADPANGDYHLMSKRGRYWPQHNVWVLDKVTSPCIDAGNPTADYSKEPAPNGRRINLGAHGGTPYASMNEWPFEWDMNYDSVVDINDLLILIDEWMQHVDWAGHH